MMNMDLDAINQLIAEKDFEQAKNALENIIQEDEKSIEALKLLGLCNVNLENFIDGKSNFETVVKYKPDDAASWFYLANCYDNLDDFLHAIPAYLQVIKLRENYLEAYKNLCVLYVKNQEAEKAVELGVKALELVQDDYTVYYIIGTAYMSIKKFDESLFYLEKALVLNPNHSQLYNNLGTSYITVGNLDKAYENFVKASELDPENSITYYNIASILQIRNKHLEACEYFEKAYLIEPNDSYLVALALSEMKAQQYESALKHYKTLISHHPEKPNYQYNLACCYEMLNDMGHAIGILSHLVMLNPKSVTMSQKLANLYLKTNKPMQAKEIYEKIIIQGNVSYELYYDFAHVCVIVRDLDKAEKILKKVIDLNPDYAPAHKDLGVIYLSKRLFDYAQDEFEIAYALDEKSFTVLFEYANFLHATTDFQKSDEFYQRALDIEPENPKALAFSALNKTQLKGFDKALELINHALKYEAEEPFLLYIAGKIRFLMKDFEDAKIYLIKSFEQDENNDTKNLLALCYYELENYKQANAIFENLLITSPMNVNLLLNSAKCFESLSDTDSALSQLEKAVGIFPECEEAQEMIRRLS